MTSRAVADAVARALADVAGVDADEVRVRVESDALDTLPARFRLEIDLAPSDDDGRRVDPSDVDDDDHDDVDDDVDDDADDSDDVAAADRSPAPSSARTDDARGRRPADRGGRGARDDEGPSPEELDEEAEAAADLLEALLDALDLPGDLRIHVRDGAAEVEIVDVGEGVLIGRRGQTLDAVQELLRTAMQQRFERRSYVTVDVEGYRARRVERLIERTDEAIDEVLSTGEPVRLEAMDVVERRIVHQRVSERDGVESHSQGRDPARRIVIEPV